MMVVRDRRAPKLYRGKVNAPSGCGSLTLGVCNPEPGVASEASSATIGVGSAGGSRCCVEMIIACV